MPSRGRPRKACKAGSERINGKCRKSCKANQVRNSSTGRCWKECLRSSKGNCVKGTRRKKLLHPMRNYGALHTMKAYTPSRY